MATKPKEKNNPKVTTQTTGSSPSLGFELMNDIINAKLKRKAELEAARNAPQPIDEPEPIPPELRGGTSAISSGVVKLTEEIKQLLEDAKNQSPPPGSRKEDKK